MDFSDLSDDAINMVSEFNRGVGVPADLTCISQWYSSNESDPSSISATRDQSLEFFCRCIAAGDKVNPSIALCLSEDACRHVNELVPGDKGHTVTSRRSQSSKSSHSS